MIEYQSNYQFPPALKRLLVAMFCKKPEALPFPVAGNYGNSTVSKPQLKRSVSRVFTRLEAERDLVTRLALGETVAAQDDLAARWGVDKSTVSRWVKAWEADGLVPARTQIGRCKQLSG